MLVGTMNHPANDVIEEIRWMAAMDLEFIDLTLEPPAAASWQVDPRAIRKELAERGMKVIGHTAFYLPIASAIEEVRRAAVEELRRCIRVFSEIGAPWMNIHPDRFCPFHDRPHFIRKNIESLRELLGDSRRLGVGLMLENLPGEFNSAAQIGEILEAVPEIGLHLDFGHANLMVPHSTAAEMLAAYGPRLQHVHLHDNRGGNDDLHLPLGAGNVDVEGAVRGLKQYGYDGTITLEVFTPDRHYLAHSRDTLKRLWDAIPRTSAAR